MFGYHKTIPPRDCAMQQPSFIYNVPSATNREVKMENSKRQTHDRQLTHPGNYSSHTYSFKKVCLCFDLRPRERFLFLTGVDDYSAHESIQTCVNSQPIMSASAHETVENKNIAWLDKQLNVHCDWSFFCHYCMLQIPFKLCWVCPLEKC